MTDKNQPLSGNAMPRFGGIATMLRLPQADSPAGLDAAFIGVRFQRLRFLFVRKRLQLVHQSPGKPCRQVVAQSHLHRRSLTRGNQCAAAFAQTVVSIEQRNLRVFVEALDIVRNDYCDAMLLGKFTTGMQHMAFAVVGMQVVDVQHPRVLNVHQLVDPPRTSPDRPPARADWHARPRACRRR